MLMSKNNRNLIYETLFTEGVMVARKDFHPKKDPILQEQSKKSVPNLELIKAMQSLKSKGYVNERFAWRHYYWYLNNNGIAYLREVLHLPPEIVPSTLKKPQKSDATRATRSAISKGEASQGDGDKGTYRRNMDKKSDVGPGSSNLEFRGGFGRGRGSHD
ncbi:small ribosomal subunit protein eS10 [Bemisia tabaci]|nr:PREDICTED: 40S ribosomal protein S10-like [Bemisia tabaci]